MLTQKIEQLINQYQKKIKDLKTDQFTDDAMPHAQYTAIVQSYENVIKDLQDLL